MQKPIGYRVKNKHSNLKLGRVVGEWMALRNTCKISIKVKKASWTRLTNVF